MVFIFLGEGFFVVLVILMALCFFGAFGTVYGIILWLLEHWYLVAFLMCLKMFIDILFYSLVAKYTVVKSQKEKLLLEKYKNKICVVNVIKSSIIFISFILFCKFEIKVLEGHPFASIAYALVYLFAVFFTFISTYITGMSLFEGFLNKNITYKYKLESWDVFTKQYKLIGMLVALSLIMLMRISIFSFILLCIASYVSFILSCDSSIE